MFSALIRGGAYLKEKDGNGNTGLHLAVEAIADSERKLLDIVALL